MCTFLFIYELQYTILYSQNAAETSQSITFSKTSQFSLQLSKDGRSFFRYININKPKPKAYDNCEVKDGIGKIFVQSYGLNYDGNYKESAIMDQRLATAIGVTYIAIKDPAIGGSTQVSSYSSILNK
jgi:hypothetical protein